MNILAQFGLVIIGFVLMIFSIYLIGKTITLSVLITKEKFEKRKEQLLNEQSIKG